MSIENQLKAFQKSGKFKKLVTEKIKTDKNFAIIAGGKDYAKKAGERMTEILRKKVSNIKNQHGEDFLNKIIIETKFEKNKGWYVDISFDNDEMHRNSLFPTRYKNGVQINILFNEGYNANNYVYGTDRHGDNLRSRLQRDGLFFVQEAVELFNAEQNEKAIAEYSSDYTGGTL